MEFKLTAHADTLCDVVEGISVEATRPGPGLLTLRYVLTGNTAAIALPAPAAPARADELWRHTCFEVFLRAGGGYYEFNLSPSTRWAAYRFDGYRSGMEDLAETAAPRIETSQSGECFELRAELAVGSLPGLAPESPWQLGLSVVIEGAEGALSYWALAHPPGKPDFHHSDCFALDIPPAWPS